MEKDIELMEEPQDKPERNVHQGHNIAIFRGMRNMKQSDLAERLGMRQQSLSEHEQKKVVNTELLQQIAVILNVPLDLLENMPEKETPTIIIKDNNFDISLEEGSSLNNVYTPNGSICNEDFSKVFHHPTDPTAEQQEQSDKERIKSLESELKELKEMFKKLREGK